jgi:hypothetical protein
LDVTETSASSHSAATQASPHSLCYCLSMTCFIDEDPVDPGLPLPTENSVSRFGDVRTPASSAIALMSNQHVGYPSIYGSVFVAEEADM